jgi:DNA-binding IclR family transcriptional regulator
MQAIYDAGGEWVAVGAMADATVQYLHVVGPHRQGRIKSGASQPLTDSALGLVLLGSLGDRAVEAIWRRTRYLNGETTSGNFDALAREVAKVRAAGHAFATTEAGYASLAMKVPGEWHGRMLGLCIEGPLAALEAKRAPLIALLRQELQQLGRPKRMTAPEGQSVDTRLPWRARPSVQTADSVAS